MKVDIGPYRGGLESRLLRNLSFSRWLNEKPVGWKEKLADRIDAILNTIYSPINAVWYRVPRVQVIHIDKYDTWSLDTTLSKIIAPALRALIEDKAGWHLGVENSDLPEYLQTDTPPSDMPEDLGQARWNYVLQEMAWAFENYENLMDDCPGISEYRVMNGIRLFARYYPNLWS